MGTERKSYAEAFNGLKIYIEDQIFDKKEVHLLVDFNSYYLWHFCKILWTQIWHTKVLKCYSK